MNIQQRKKMMEWGAAGLALAGVGVLALGLGLPVRAEPAAPDAGAVKAAASIHTQPTQSPAAPTEPAVDLAELQALCAVNLRRPLFGPGGESLSVVAGPLAASLSVRLVGTVTEQGHNMAVLQKSDGTIEVCPQGQSIDDAGGAVQVVHVEDMRATVRYAGGTADLVVPPPPPLPTP